MADSVFLGNKWCASLVVVVLGSAVVSGSIAADSGPLVIAGADDNDETRSVPLTVTVGISWRRTRKNENVATRLRQG